MAVSREICPVSFSMEDPFEKQLFTHAKQYNFSKYVKRLIAADMTQQPISSPNIPVSIQTPTQEPIVQQEKTKQSDKPPVLSSIRSFV